MDTFKENLAKQKFGKFTPDNLKDITVFVYG